MSGADRVARKGGCCEIWRTEQARNERARGLADNLNSNRRNVHTYIGGERTR